MPLARWLTISLLPLLLAGCASSSLLITYPQRFAAVSSELQQGQSAQALEQLSAGIDGSDGLLYAQESGRVAALSGDTAASIDYYRQALSDYQQYDWKALISLSDLGAQALGASISDNLIPYRGQAYERVLVHQQQSLNYLWQGRYEDALVQVRQGDQAQHLALQAFGELESNRALQSAAIDSQLTQLDRAAGDAPDSFINPYVLYSNAVLYEGAGQANDALIDVRKALQLRPENQLLQQNFVRLSCQLQIDCASAQAQFGAAPPIAANQGQLVLLYERGSVSPRQSIRLPIIWDGNYQQLALPTYYSRPSFAPSAVQLNGQRLGLSALVNVDAMAARALREQYPYIITRQALRIAAKHGANEWAEHAGGDVGSVLMQLVNAVTEQADRRSWLSLPQQVDGWQGALAAGQHQLQIAGQTLPITIEPNRITLVWVAETGNLRQIQSQLL
ncbi:COG3014 family protein [Ferrimonas senticii]|uniref:COG3014 family protein n=1 Tax=Ferrimonas senticii TaxID=394566 RepID=UPI00041A8F31|nr:hypothetical protein [Ferrimonas senticii]